MSEKTIGEMSDEELANDMDLCEGCKCHVCDVCRSILALRHKVESLTQAFRDIQDFDPNCYGKGGVCFDCPYCVTVKAIGEPDYEN
jgi:hypothetical protein